jgi:hypothetical protein
MTNRLPKLSYRLAHHFPEALPFIVPFYNKLTEAGFEIDGRHIKPVRTSPQICPLFSGHPPVE